MNIKISSTLQKDSVPTNSTFIQTNQIHSAKKIQHYFTLFSRMSPQAETLSLAGKTAIITGSGRETGIGAAIARALARNGANVAIHYVSETSQARAEKVAGDIEREFGTKTVVVRGGMESFGNAEEMIRRVLEGLGVGKVDILGMSEFTLCFLVLFLG